MVSASGFHAAQGVLLITEVVVIVLVVFTVLFALAIIWVAFWYHTRQDKQVRMDEDEDEVYGFRSRPGESEEDEEEASDDLEPGTSRFRRA